MEIKYDHVRIECDHIKVSRFHRKINYCEVELPIKIYILIILFLILQCEITIFNSNVGYTLNRVECALEVRTPPLYVNRLV